MITEKTFEEEMIQTVKRIRKDKITPRAMEVDERDEFPHDLARTLAENGLLRMSLPEEYGGIDASSSLLSQVIEELSRGLAMMGTTMLSTHTVIRMVALGGTEPQKERFFKALSKEDASVPSV